MLIMFSIMAPIHVALCTANGSPLVLHCLCTTVCIPYVSLAVPAQIHTMHQSLRDLRCDQQRLSDDLDREILRRNRYQRGGSESHTQRPGFSTAECNSRVGLYDL